LLHIFQHLLKNTPMDPLANSAVITAFSQHNRAFFSIICLFFNKIPNNPEKSDLHLDFL